MLYVKGKYMIQSGSKLEVADNSGAKSVACIKVSRGINPSRAELGQVITISVKSAAPRGIVKKKDVVKAVIVRQVKPRRRPDGTTIRFDNNAVVLINDDNTPKGTRIFGPIAREVRECGFTKIISLAPEVL